MNHVSSLTMLFLHVKSWPKAESQHWNIEDTDNDRDNDGVHPKVLATYLCAIGHGSIKCLGVCKHSTLPNGKKMSILSKMLRIFTTCTSNHFQGAQNRHW